MPGDQFELPTVGVWGGALRAVSMKESQELAAELEELGYGAIWFPESDARDVFVNIGLLLGATRHLIGGTAVANIWARDPLAMATAARTLTEAFPDRLLLGLGVSHQLLVDGMRKQHYDKPLTTMRKYLDGMDAATYTAYPPSTPVRRLIAALGPRMLELAAARSDGVVPYLVTPEHTAIARKAVPDGLVCTVQAVVLDNDTTRARETARALHTSYYMALPNYTNNLLRLGFTSDDLLDGGSDRLVDGVVASGGIDAILTRLQAHLDAGADHVCVQVIDRSQPPTAVWRELAPALAGLATSKI